MSQAPCPGTEKAHGTGACEVQGAPGGGCGPGPQSLEWFVGTAISACTALGPGAVEGPQG